MELKDNQVLEDGSVYLEAEIIDNQTTIWDFLKESILNVETPMANR